MTIEEMSGLEQCFNLKINVVSSNSSGSGNVIYESLFKSENVMYLNNYQNHLSYITNYSKFANKFQFEKCLKALDSYIIEYYSNCYERTKYIFPRGFHRKYDSIFDNLESLTICVPESQRYYPSFFSVWDKEAILLKTNIPSSDQLNFLSKHVPVRVTVASNAERFYEPKCFVEISSNLLAPR